MILLFYLMIELSTHKNFCNDANIYTSKLNWRMFTNMSLAQSAGTAEYTDGISAVG